MKNPDLRRGATKFSFNAGCAISSHEAGKVVACCCSYVACFLRPHASSMEQTQGQDDEEELRKNFASRQVAILLNLKPPC